MISDSDPELVFDFIDNLEDFETEGKHYVSSTFKSFKTFEGGDDSESVTSSASADSGSIRPRSPLNVVNKAIPTNDIRRSFARVFEAAINSCDKDQLRKGILNITTDDLLLTIEYPKGNPHGPRRREVRGREAVVEYMSMSLMSMPDALYLVHETKLYLLPNDCSCVMAKYSFTASKLYFVEYEGTKVDNSERKEKAVESLNSDIRSIKQFLQFKGSSISKYDKFKSEKHRNSTIGEFLACDEDERAYKRRKSSDFSCSSSRDDGEQASVQHVLLPGSYSSTYNMTAGGDRVVAGGGEILHERADNDTKYRLSKVFQVAQNAAMIGFMRYHTNAELKIFHVEVITAYTAK